MPNRTVRANAIALPIADLTADPALRRALTARPGDPEPLPAAVTRPKTKPPAGGAAISPALRRKIELAVERLISALDAIDAPEEDLEDGADLEDGHDLEDDPAESGIGDPDGFAEQLSGEPDLGATEAFDQRHAWRAPSGWPVLDGEATGTVDDVDPGYEPVPAWQARKAAGQQALADLRAIVGRKSREASR